MQLTSTFQLIETIASLVVRPRQLVSSNADNAKKSKIMALMDKKPFSDYYKKQSNESIHYRSIPIELNYAYPLNSVASVSGIDVQLISNSPENHELTEPVIAHYIPDGSAGSKQLLIFGNPILRAHYSLNDLEDFDFVNDPPSTSRYYGCRNDAYALVEAVINSFEEIFRGIFFQTGEIDLFQYSDIKYITDPYVIKEEDSCVLYEEAYMIIDAIVLAIMKRVYELVCDLEDDSIRRGYKQAMKKLTDVIYVFNIVDGYNGSKVNPIGYQLYCELLDNLSDIMILRTSQTYGASPLDLLEDFANVITETLSQDKYKEEDHSK